MRIYVALACTASGSKLAAANPRTTLVLLRPDNPYKREDRPPCSGGAQERVILTLAQKVASSCPVIVSRCLMPDSARTRTKLLCFSFLFYTFFLFRHHPGHSIAPAGTVAAHDYSTIQLSWTIPGFFFGVAKEKLRFPYCTRSCQSTTGGKHERVGKSRKWLVSSLSIYRRPELGVPQLNSAAKSATPFCSFNQTYLVDKPHERPVVRTRGQLSK